MQNITPFLWFDDKAEEAVNFYVSVFPGSRVLGTTRYDENSAKASGRPAGSVMTLVFELNGQRFTALNGGPAFKFTEAVSFVVECDNQEELDSFWAKLAEGGEEKAQQCGWLKDRYGLSWQIIPASLGRLLADPDPAKSKRVMDAMLQMKKIDIAALENARGGS